MGRFTPYDAGPPTATMTQCPLCLAVFPVGMGHACARAFPPTFFPPTLPATHPRCDCHDCTQAREKARQYEGNR